MKNKLNLIIFLIILFFFCSSCKFKHTHDFTDGKCSCGEEDSNYTRIKYTITFIDYDNTIIKTVTINKGENVFFPDNPRREGFLFVGWDHDLENIESDLTVKAIYNQLEEKLLLVLQKNISL